MRGNNRPHRSVVRVKKNMLSSSKHISGIGTANITSVIISLHLALQTTDLPKIIEVCELQSSITIREELTVAFVIHVRLYSFRGVKGFPFLIAPRANLPHADFLSWQNKKVFEEKI